MIATYNQISSIANFDLSDLQFSDLHHRDADFPDAVSASDACLEMEVGSSTIGEPQNRAWHMKCECLNERHIFDLLDHVYRLHQEPADAAVTSVAWSSPRTGTAGNPRWELATPILIYVTDYQEAVEIDRCLSAVKLRTHLASPFSNWTNVLGKLGTGQLDVIISTTAEIPHADQIPWRAIYLPSALHLAMLTTPQMDWLGNLWFANHVQETPPRLIIRRTKS